MADKYKHIGFTEGGKRVFKQNKKLYLKKKNKYVALPKNTKVISIDNYKASQDARGKEVSVTGSSEYAQFVYGRMRVGGTYIFIDTSQNTYSYLVSGTGTHSLLWTAKTAGISGNNITVRLISSGTVGAISVSVIGNAIEVTLRSSGGTPLSTRDEVISAVQAATNLVSITRVGESGNGVVQPMSTTNLSYGGGNTLHQFLSITCHEIDLVEKLYIDDREVTFGASPDPRWATGIFQDRVFMSQVYGSDFEEAQPDLRSQLPAMWSTDHTHKGMSGAYIILNYDSNTFAEGFPELEFLIRGKKCYDPRTATTVWTQNAALIIADYLTNTKFGMGIPYSKIDEATLIDSANNCDENVTLQAGGTEKRYTINGRFDCSMTHRQVLEEMALAMAGSIVFQGGKYYILSGKWRASVASINEDDFRGALRISLNVSKRDNYNGIKGTYINPSNKYDEAEYTLVKNSTYITQDGAENFLDINFNLIHSNPTAQRIAKIMLERNRQAIEVSAQMSARLLNLVVGDTVTISFSKYGWSSKPFEVKDFNPSVDPESGVGTEITFRETASGIYTDSMAEVTYDLAANTTLPNAYTVVAPTNLILTSGTNELYLRNDGTVFSRLKAAWTATNDLFVVSGGRYQIEYKKSADSTWIALAPIPASQSYVHILDVQDGVNYDVRVKAINTIGVSSSYITSTNHTVIGKTAPPATVTGFSVALSDFGIMFNWTANTELDISEYEIRVGASWAAGTFVWRGRGITARWENKTSGSYTFWIKAIDTSGNASTNAASQGLTIASPTTPTVTTQLDGFNIKLSWTASTGAFAIKEYEIRSGASYASGNLEAIVTGLNFSTRVNWSGAKNFWVAARDISGNTGTAGGATRTISNPNPIQNLEVTTVDNNVLIDFDDPVAGDLPIAEYKIYKGATFLGSTLVGTVYGTFHTYIEKTGGEYTYWVVSIDTAGNQSSEVSYTATITPPSDYVLRSSLEFINNTDTEALIKERFKYARRTSGNVIALSHLDSNLYYDFDRDVTLVSGAVSQVNDQSGNENNGTQTTAASRPTLLANNINGHDLISLDGSNDFITTPLNLNINGGFSLCVFVNKAAATVQGICAAVSGVTADNRLRVYSETNGNIVVEVRNGNNYIGRSAPASTIVVNEPCIISVKYEGGTSNSSVKIYKNNVRVDTADFASGVYTVPTTAGAALLIGVASSAYWNGKIGDFIIKQQGFWSDSDIKLEVARLRDKYLESETEGLPDKVMLPLDLETWDEWWTEEGWTTWNDAVTAYNADYPTPNIRTGYAKWLIDYEAVLPASFIGLSWIRELIGDDITITPTIKTSTDGTSWTTYTGASEVYSTGFRYVEYILDFSASIGTELINLTEVRAVVSLKTAEEEHVINCVSTDSYLGNPGTYLEFDKNYISVSDIQATVLGTFAAITVVNFNGVPNPTYCQVLVFNTSGARITADVSVRIKGALNT